MIKVINLKMQTELLSQIKTTHNMIELLDDNVLTPTVQNTNEEGFVCSVSGNLLSNTVEQVLNCPINARVFRARIYNFTTPANSVTIDFKKISEGGTMPENGGYFFETAGTFKIPIGGFTLAVPDPQ